MDIEAGTRAAFTRATKVQRTSENGSHLLTLPAINAARHLLFLISGAAKAEAVARVRSGERLPAALVQPSPGRLTWLLDAASAGLIECMKQK